MTTKERLHQLIEELSERDVPRVEKYLASLVAEDDPVRRALDAAPEEPATEEEIAAILAAKARRAAGERGIPHAEARRLLLED